MLQRNSELDFTFVKMMKQMTFLKTRVFWTISGYILGAIGGYIYFLNVQCETGCYMKTSPVFNVILGFFIGGFLFQFIHEFFIAKQK